MFVKVCVAYRTIPVSLKAANDFITEHHRHNKKVTLTGITTFNLNTHQPDNVKATFGNTAASPDFYIVHDTNNTILSDSGVGAIHIRGDNVAIQNAGGTETQALFTENERVKLLGENQSKEIEKRIF